VREATLPVAAVRSDDAVAALVPNQDDKVPIAVEVEVAQVRLHRVIESVDHPYGGQITETHAWRTDNGTSRRAMPASTSANASTREMAKHCRARITATSDP